MIGVSSVGPWGRLLPLLLLSALLGLPGVFSACSPVSLNDPPLPDSTFSRLLVEMHLLSARAEREGRLPPGVEDSLLSRYGVEPQAFEATLRYYSRRPEQLNALYDSVVDTLSALEKRSRYEETAPSNRPRAQDPSSETGTSTP